jgi:signal peptidase I
MRLTPRTGFAFAATLAFLAVGWWLLGPSQLGGPTSYAIISGSSMEPGLTAGDLVLTRAKSSYEVGDAVLYQDHETNVRVLHRIVAQRGGHFVTKGDNNDFVDPVRPLPDEVLGRMWFSVPGAGSVLSWLKQPVHLAILLGLLLLVGVGGGREVTQRRAPANRPVVALPDAAANGPAVSATVGRAFATVGVVALALFATLAVVAWATSESSTRPVARLYAHAGTFAYSAETKRDAVYPSGTVETGMPVFTRLVDTLRVSFSYRLDAARASDLHGSIGLDAVVRDTSGWERTLLLAPDRTFVGPTASVEGLFDVDAFEELVVQARELTAAPLAAITVELRPRVAVSGTTGPTRVDDTFGPHLDFSYDGTTLQPLPPAGASPGTAPSFSARRLEPGTVTLPRTVGVGSHAFGVDDARRVSLLGVAASLAVLLLGAGLLVSTGGRTRPGRIEARHGSRIVPARAVVPEERWVTDVDDIEDLVRIADAYDRVILRVAEDDGDVYLVDDGIAVYRYRARAEQGGAASPLPSPSW